MVVGGVVAFPSWCTHHGLGAGDDTDSTAFPR